MDRSGKLHFLDKAHVKAEWDEGEIANARRLWIPAYGEELQNVIAYLKIHTARDLSQTIRAALPGGLDYGRIQKSSAEPQNGLTYWGDYQGTHFSSLHQIDTAEREPSAIPLGDAVAWKIES